jgi:hypothetical protein
VSIIGGAWTYSGSPATDLKDRVWFLIGDTDVTRQQISDEEILWALSDRANNYYAAAATCCRVLAARTIDANKVTVGDVTEEGGTGKSWMDLADEYDRRAVSLASCPSPFLGGGSVDRRSSNATDTDRTPPRAWFGQFDNPRVNLTSTSTAAT